MKNYKITELESVEEVGCLAEQDIVRCKSSKGDDLALVIKNTAISPGDFNFIVFREMPLGSLELFQYIGIKKDQTPPQFDLIDKKLIFKEDGSSSPIYYQRISPEIIKDNYSKYVSIIKRLKK
ncbi:hypothetical protein KAT36_01215 [Candidatus Pacearchaeota archaeon]|nr:hypothetical protein [Candidatus Pacearchaeota archaeon]